MRSNHAISLAVSPVPHTARHAMISCASHRTRLCGCRLLPSSRPSIARVSISLMAISLGRLTDNGARAALEPPPSPSLKAATRTSHVRAPCSQPPHSTRPRLISPGPLGCRRRREKTMTRVMSHVVGGRPPATHTRQPPRPHREQTRSLASRREPVAATQARRVLQLIRAALQHSQQLTIGRPRKVGG